VMDDAMKESVKITVIAAGFREVAGRKTHQKPSYLPKTWKAAREPEPVQEPHVVQQVSQPVNQQVNQQRQPNVVQQVSRNVSEVVQQVTRNVTEKMNDVPADDLDVPTFLRRQAQKA
jgi:hypothetical protein